LAIEGTIFVQSILLSTNVVDIPMDDQRRGELACSIAEGSCSYCNDEDAEQICPEWTEDDVKIGKMKGMCCLRCPRLASHKKTCDPTLQFYETN